MALSTVEHRELPRGCREPNFVSKEQDVPSEPSLGTRRRATVWQTTLSSVLCPFGYDAPRHRERLAIRNDASTRHDIVVNQQDTSTKDHCSGCCCCNDTINTTNFV